MPSQITGRTKDIARLERELETRASSTVRWLPELALEKLSLNFKYYRFLSITQSQQNIFDRAVWKPSNKKDLPKMGLNSWQHLQSNKN